MRKLVEHRVTHVLEYSYNHSTSNSNDAIDDGHVVILKKKEEKDIWIAVSSLEGSTDNYWADNLFSDQLTYPVRRPRPDLWKYNRSSNDASDDNA